MMRNQAPRCSMKAMRRPPDKWQDGGQSTHSQRKGHAAAKRLPRGVGETEKGLRLVDVNPSAATVPKRGLEPPPPLQGPGPEPGASASSATSASGVARHVS